MNPMLQEALTSLIRHGLQFLSGYLVARGIWTESQATMYVGAATLFILTYGWNYIQKRMSREKLMTALASSKPMTENEVTAMVKDPTVPTPPASVPKDVVPLMGTPPEPPPGA